VNIAKEKIMRKWQRMQF